MLARSQREVAIYTITGRAIGQVPSPTGEPVEDRWLPNSSGALVWPVSPQGATGRLIVVDSDGRITRTSLPGGDTALSPNGAWLAATEVTTGGPDAILALERHGTVPRAVVKGGVRLLGWSGDKVIYTDDANVYAIAPAGGAPSRLMPVPAGVQLGEPEFGPSTSPDGQIMLVRKNHQGYLVLVGNTLVGLPAGVMTGPNTVFWIGAHAVLGLSGSGQIVDVDLISGKVIETPARVPPQSAYVESVSGSSLEWESLVDHHAHVANLATGKDDDLGPKPEPGVVMPISGSRFLLAAAGGDAFVFGPSPSR